MRKTIGELLGSTGMLTGVSSFFIFIFTTDLGPETPMSYSNSLLSFVFIIPLQIYLYIEFGQFAVNLIVVGSLQITFLVLAPLGLWLMNSDPKKKQPPPRYGISPATSRRRLDKKEDNK